MSFTTMDGTTKVNDRKGGGANYQRSTHANTAGVHGKGVGGRKRKGR